MLKPTINCNWEEFKHEAKKILNSQITSKQFFFRGQSNHFKCNDTEYCTLISSLHRLSYDFEIEDYLFRMIPEIYRDLRSAKYDCPPYNIENGETLNPRESKKEAINKVYPFFAYLQHHGYPTIFLDWTYSPYVAAYFAIEEILNLKSDIPKFISIFCFDTHEWENYISSDRYVGYVNPPTAPYELFKRIAAQEGCSTFSNQYDIAGFIREVEKKVGKVFLCQFNIKSEEKYSITKELSSRGITAKTLFPDTVEGVCKFHKNKILLNEYKIGSKAHKM